jgi:hypothetical protein
MSVSAPTSTSSFYPNGQKQFEFTPSGQGGQAGQYTYYGKDGKKLLTENKSVDGRVGFEQDYNRDGSTYSTTISGANGAGRTMVYGPK